MYTFTAGIAIVGAGIAAISIGSLRKSRWIKYLGRMWLVLGIAMTVIGLVLINGGYW